MDPATLYLVPFWPYKALPLESLPNTEAEDREIRNLRRQYMMQSRQECTKRGWLPTGHYNEYAPLIDEDTDARKLATAYAVPLNALQEDRIDRNAIENRAVLAWRRLDENSILFLVGSEVSLSQPAHYAVGIVWCPVALQAEYDGDEVPRVLCW